MNVEVISGVKTKLKSLHVVSEPESIHAAKKLPRISTPGGELNARARSTIQNDYVILYVPDVLARH